MFIHKQRLDSYGISMYYIEIPSIFMSITFHTKEPSKNVISVKTAAHSTGYSTSYISRLCRTGKISCEQDNKEWLIDTQSLEEFITNRKKRKQANAATLARSRRDAYHYSQIEKRSTQRLPSEGYMRTITPQPVWQKIAFAGVSLIVIFSTSSLALSGGISTFINSGDSTLHESLQGFGEIVTNATNSVSQQIIAAAAIGIKVRRTSAHIVLMRTIPLNISMQDIYTASRIVLPVVTTYAPLQSPALIAQKTLKKLPTYTFEQQFYAAVIATTHISGKEILHGMVHDYVGSGQFMYSLIEKGFSGYHVMLMKSGVVGLAFGATTRDVLIKTPPAIWRGVVNTTQFSIHGYVAVLNVFVGGVVYTLFEGNKKVLVFGTTIFNNVGSTASTASAYIP